MTVQVVGAVIIRKDQDHTTAQAVMPPLTAVKTAGSLVFARMTALTAESLAFAHMRALTAESQEFFRMQMTRQCLLQAIAAVDLHLPRL